MTQQKNRPNVIFIACRRLLEMSFPFFDESQKNVRKLASKTSFRTNCGGEQRTRTVDLPRVRRTL